VSWTTHESSNGDVHADVCTVPLLQDYYADMRATGNFVSYGSYETAPKFYRYSSLENT